MKPFDLVGGQSVAVLLGVNTSVVKDFIPKATVLAFRI